MPTPAVSEAIPAIRRAPWWLMLPCLCGLVFAQGLEFGQALFQWMESKYGIAARERAEDLQQLITRYSQAQEQEKLEKVNDFFNAVDYASDWAQWDHKDYWATPFEVLGVNSADCEDYALSKFFTLISMGVPEEKLRITYVKAVELNEAHMVLAYYPSPEVEPLILDNLKGSIRPAGDRGDLVPVYSFNGTALWVAVNRLEGKRVGGADRLSRWKSFQKKLQEQMGG